MGSHVSTPFDPRARAAGDGPSGPPSAETALREAADRFHKIVTGIASARLLAREGVKMSSLVYESMAADVLSSEEIEKIAADGFEVCVRALARLGAPDVSIHECRAEDIDP